MEVLHSTFWVGTAAGSQTSLDSGSNFAVGKRRYFLRVVNLGLDNCPCLSAWATLLPRRPKTWAKMKSETTPESPHARQEWRPLQIPPHKTWRSSASHKSCDFMRPLASPSCRPKPTMAKTVASKSGFVLQKRQRRYPSTCCFWSLVASVCTALFLSCLLCWWPSCLRGR